jgi:hypothetical protein
MRRTLHLCRQRLRLFQKSAGRRQARTFQETAPRKLRLFPISHWHALDFTH